MTDKAIEWAIDLPEQDFREVVTIAMRAKDREPAKWRLLLEPELIDATRGVLEDYIADAERQMETPGIYPKAGRYLSRVRVFMLDLEMTEKLRAES